MPSKMLNNTIVFASNTVELSEFKSYIELTNLLCYYDAPNDNGVQLPYDDKALERAQSLVNMPVVAKYKLINNKPDLGGHEAYIDKKTKEIAFNTDEIGTHTSVEIKNTEVDLHGKKITLPCLYATIRIWTERHKNTVAAIKRLYKEGKLTSSWEMNVSNYEYKDDIKILKDYIFLANCLLGSKVLPAYPCATVLDMSSLNQSQVMIAEALCKDKEESNLESTNINPTVEEQPTAEVSQQENEPTNDTETTQNSNTPQVEQSMLTVRDLRKKLSECCREKLKPAYVWVSFIVVDEGYCLCDSEDTDELEFYKFTYTISDGEVSVGEPEKIKLIVPIGQVNSAISSRDEAILQSKTTISELEGQVSELKKYKDIVDKAETEKAEAEKAEKIENLKKLAQTGGYITIKEIEEDDTIKTMISSLDESGIKNLIVDRMLAKEKEHKSAQTETSSLIHTDVTDDAGTEKVSAFNFYMNLK